MIMFQSLEIEKFEATPSDDLEVLVSEVLVSAAVVLSIVLEVWAPKVLDVV